MIWIVLAYFSAQVLHMLAGINVTVNSKLNALHGIRDYLKLRWPPLVGRLAVNTACFVLIWDNPKMVGLESYAVSVAAKVALAFVLGWFSDSVFDKVLGTLSTVFPNLQKDAPVVPQIEPDKKE